MSVIDDQPPEPPEPEIRSIAARIIGCIVDILYCFSR